MKNLKKLDEYIREHVFVSDDVFAEIQEIGESIGVTYKPKECGCSKRDFLFIVYSAYCKMLQKKHVQAGKRKLYLRAGLRCRFNEARVNEVVIRKDKQIEDLLKKGFPRKYTRTLTELQKHYEIEQEN
jgi:hemerythrin-like domain-containing protein